MREKKLARQCRDAMYATDRAVHALGISVDVGDVGTAETTMEVRPDMVNGHGVCHGGILFTLADTAFAYACNSRNEVTFAASAAIEFLRPAKVGERIVATAAERHRGGRTGIYDVSVRNQDGREIAVFRGRSHNMRAPLVEEK